MSDENGICCTCDQSTTGFFLETLNVVRALQIIKIVQCHSFVLDLEETLINVIKS